MDLQKLPPKSQFVFEQRQPQYIINSKITKKYIVVKDDFAKLPQPEAPDLGGYPFVITSGIATSGTSISTVRTYQIVFIPREGVIPSHELNLHQMARNLEQVVNLSEKEEEK